MDVNPETILFILSNCFLVNKPIEPQLEHQQRPKLMRIISLCANMQVDQLLDGFGLEHATTQSLFRQNNLAQKRLHLATKPVTNRNSKSHFSTRQILARQKLLQYFFQQILAPQSS